MSSHPAAAVQYTFTHTHTHTQYTKDTKKTIHRTKEKILEECWSCPVFAGFTRALALKLRKRHGITSVRAAERFQLARRVSAASAFYATNVFIWDIQNKENLSKPFIYELWWLKNFTIFILMNFLKIISRFSILRKKSFHLRHTEWRKFFKTFHLRIMLAQKFHYFNIDEFS